MTDHRSFRAGTVLVTALLTLGSTGVSQEPQDDELDELEELLDTRAEGTETSVNVLGLHRHFDGEWMVSYRPMLMRMDGNRNGTTDLPAEDVLQDFPVTPLDMSMEMHMVGVMYAPSDRLTLMTMIPYVRIEMDHRTRMGQSFTTRTNGLGDVKVGGVWTAFDRDLRRVLITGKLGLPTGSIDERDATPMGPDQPLPYPMQLGSGTWDLIPGLAYAVEKERWFYSTELEGTLRLDENDESYALGDRIALDLRLHRRVAASWSLSASLRGEAWGDVDGADPRLNPGMVPTADPDLRGGERADLSFGVNYFLPRGRGSEGLRTSLEIGAPVYQSLDGPQLKADTTLLAAIQWTWNP